MRDGSPRCIPDLTQSVLKNTQLLSQASPRGSGTLIADGDRKEAEEVIPQDRIFSYSDH